MPFLNMDLSEESKFKSSKIDSNEFILIFISYLLFPLIIIVGLIIIFGLLVTEVVRDTFRFLKKKFKKKLPPKIKCRKIK
jgi:hypothetical protein